MVASFRKTFMIWGLIGILVFSTLSYIIVLQTNNGVTDTILKNTVINNTFSSLQDNLTSFSSQTQTQRESFESEIPERGFGSLIIFSIVSVGQKFMAIVISTYNILIILPASILGIPEIVTNVLSSILVVSLILLVWRVYRVGS